MINQILTAIDNVLKRKEEFVVSENAFSRNRKWSLDRYVKFQIFRERTTTRHDINTFYLNSPSDHYERITRGNYSRRRMLIKPELYQEINQEYLEQIKFDQNLSIHKTYKDFSILAVDGLTLPFDNNKELRKDFKVKGGNLNYRNPSEAKFTAIMDVLNGHIIDGELGDFRQSERELMKINVSNAQNLIDFSNSILTLDRGFLSLEIMAWLNEKGIYFVQRLKIGAYKAEVNQIKDFDSPIDIKLNSGRLRAFKDPELKEKYSKKLYFNLRIVTVELDNDKLEQLLTNIPPEIMSTDEIYHIYGDRWIIETNYNTLKNRLKIGNYTSNTKENIKQDVYSIIIKYNIAQSYNIICNKLLDNKLIKQGIKPDENAGYVYKIDFANLIRNLNDFLFKMIIDPTNNNIGFLTSWLIHESCLEPNKIENNRKYPRYKTKNTRYSRSYAEM